ncbi:universal stress protein [Sediminitomix flava]|uniref:Nucleotide-binding universal stress UspA family protein n=1 Tax=Sediminitomix flava TaxID=379075 RepID=A0A315ZGM9_SEDFL|nr:universal stress protein [Sediminitomix flava]PWJ44319.1 nucleotide-binding universal stress UspA family protein [Sediminitomix flava]
MYDFKNILVALDRSEMDRILLNNLYKLQPMVSVEKVYFLHVTKNEIIPDEITGLSPLLMGPSDVDLEEEIREQLKEIWEKQERKKEYEIHIEKGSMSKRLIEFSEKKDVDLIIFGKKLKRKGVKSRQVARFAHCSVLIVPENIPEKLDHIAVAVDFSSSSIDALEIGINVARHNENTKLSAIHLYELPVGYTTVGHSYDETNSIMKENIQKNFDALLEKIDTKGVKIETLPIFKPQYETFEKSLTHTLHELDASTVVIGSHGRDAFVEWMLGSSTEKFLDISLDIPVFITKKKGKFMPIIDSFFDK